MNQPDKQSTPKEQPAQHRQLLDWWEQLEQNRGDRAALRRASSIEQVMFNPGFHRLWHRLTDSPWSRAERVALIAALGARVKHHDPRKSFAAQLGSPPSGREKAAFSGLRFRRLLQASQPNELLQACSRAITMCDGRVNLTNLAESVYWWSDRDRKSWAFDYYEANPAAD
ncbi:MAG: type I-E CRISPR-associated protein Cse2/CasB [Wenzhouxiangella sp.]|nr:MAG: type I-E CRISPR-associated protein Cse2/CasB [Wenzhouxiangella sp.]